MLDDFNMEIVLRQNFYDFFAEHRYNLEDNELLYRMEAFDKKTVRYFSCYLAVNSWGVLSLWIHIV